MKPGHARVAVVGTGIAGATCARQLADAGHAVTLYDKSRGVGGRMATRRAEWVDADGSLQRARFDHGLISFGVRSPAFAAAVAQARADALLLPWAPRLAPGSHMPVQDAPTWVVAPDMPAWCRQIIAGLDLHTSCTVDRLQRGPAHWSLHAGATTVGEGFDAVIVAIPPAQAAPLLQDHRVDWAQSAIHLRMAPVWALMAVTDEPRPAPPWDLALPATGPLARAVRDDAKPGRERRPGLAHWVVHATADWSRAHLETPAPQVLQHLQQALADRVGVPLQWHHAVVHRWRYAFAGHACDLPDPVARCWWDAALGLGVCGDALGGGGVEGAWHSACALAEQVIDHRPGSQARDLMDLHTLAHA